MMEPSTDHIPYSQPVTSLLGLSELQIESLLGVADERTAFEEDHSVYLTFLHHGLSIKFEHAIVDAVFVYSGRIGGYETMNWTRYPGPLPHGLHLDQTVKDVVRMMGPPEHAGYFPEAPIPFISHSYTSCGLGFNFIETTGEIIYIIFFEPKVLIQQDL